MDKQLDTTQELGLNDDSLRDLLDSEILLIGGGDIVISGY